MATLVTICGATLNVVGVLSDLATFWIVASIWAVPAVLAAISTAANKAIGRRAGK